MKTQLTQKTEIRKIWRTGNSRVISLPIDWAKDVEYVMMRVERDLLLIKPLPSEVVEK